MNNKKSLIGMSAAAALSAIRSMASVPAQPAMPEMGFMGSAKRRFVNMLKRISPTKRYASKTLRSHKSGQVQCNNSGRGAIGARERAVGQHWVKSLA